MSVLSLLKNRKQSLNDLLTIDKLKGKNIKLGTLDMKEKKNVKILFVDDEGFDTQVLQNLGYLDIQKMYKYDNESRMDDFEKYDIIFCDINGVAKELDSVYQGAALAKLIKQTYPSKIVVIYSAKQQYLTFNSYYEEVDDVIVKNIPPADLADKINKYINKMNDPIEFWNNIRKQLINKNISSTDISLLEHYYVKSLLDKKDYTKYIKSINDGNILSTATAIINAITSAIELYLMVAK